MKGKESLRRYSKTISRYYPDLKGNMHDRLVRFCAAVIICEMRRKGENHFQKVMILIENQNWSAIEQCLTKRYGHIKPMKFLHRDDITPENRSALVAAFTLAWNMSPLFEKAFREQCKVVVRLAA